MGALLDKYLGKTNQSQTPLINSYKMKQTSNLYSDKPVSSIEEWANDDERMGRLSTYMISRFGENGEKRENESNEDYIKRFLTHMRKVEFNSIGIMGQIDYLRGADEENRRRFGSLMDDYNNLPGMGKQGGDTVARTTWDVTKALALDPINLVGFGFAKLGTALVGRVAAKEGLKRFIPRNTMSKSMFKKLPAIKGAAGGATIGAIDSAMYNLGGQEITRKAYATDIYTGEQKTPESEIDTASVAFDTILGAGIGGALGAGIGTLVGKQARKSKYKSILQQRANRAMDDADNEATDAIKGPITDAERNWLNGLEKYDPKKGKDILQQQIKVGKNAYVDARVLLDVSRRMVKVVENITKEQAAIGAPITLITRTANNQKVSDTVFNIINNVDTIDKDVLQKALRKSKVKEKNFLEFLASNEEFAHAQKKSLSDAAKEMAGYSNLGKLKKQLLELDPSIKKRMEELFGETDDVTSNIGSFYKMFQRLDRERRALMVTQVATTARNVATGLAVITFETLANTLESTLMHGGKAFKSLLKDGGSSKGFQKGLENWAKDSFGLIELLVRQNKSGEMSQLMLKDNPRLNSILFRQLQEVGAEEVQTLSSFSRMMNILNITQDAIFRRAFFSYDMDKKLRRAGYSFEDMATDGKGLTVKEMRGSMEYALKNTFAMMPRSGPAYHFVKFVESFPMVPVIGTGEFPFARFMANAMAFQLKYSPLNGAYGLYQGAVARVMKGLGKEVKPAQWLEVRDRISKGMVGTAALMSAIYYREKNQDTEWFNIKTSDGRTVDMRPFFPAAPYFIVADMIVKKGNGELDKMSGRDFIDGFTGAQFRAGTASYTVDKFYEIMGSEEGLEGVSGERLGELVGGYVGELSAGYLTPLRVTKDIVAAFDEEEAIVRDSSMVEGQGWKERGVHAFLNKIQKGVPFWSQSMPEFESPVRGDKVMTQSPILGQMLGLRFRERANPAESELVRLGYKTFEVQPSTGDKAADMYIKRELGPLVETYIGNLIESDQYKNASEAKKLALAKNYLKELRSIAKEFGAFNARQDAQIEGKAFTPFDRTQWLRLPRNARKLANQWFKKKNNGKTVEELGQYRKGAYIGRLLARKPELAK